jgi:cytochrome P450
MMAFGVRAMLEHRDQWERLQADRTLVPTAVEECLRHRSLIKRNFRLALEDAEVAGVTIPKGAMVAIGIQSANRDEATFPEPERFDIARREDNLAFGRGTHFCLGAPLSKLEMRITLELLLELAPEMRLVDDQVIAYKQDLRLDGMRALRLDLGPVPGARRAG